MCWWCTPWHGWLSDDTWMPHVINDVSFRKRASNCRSLLWRETNKDKYGATLNGLQMTHEWHTWSMTSLSAKETLIVGLFFGERLITISTARHWMACRWHTNDIRDQCLRPLKSFTHHLSLIYHMAFRWHMNVVRDESLCPLTPLTIRVRAPQGIGHFPPKGL